MSTALDILRIANVLIWAGLLAFMFEGAKTAVIGKETRRGDPMRLGVAFVCLVMIGGNLRWLFAPESQTLLAVVHIMAAAVGLYIARLASAYGRGPRI